MEQVLVTNRKALEAQLPGEGFIAQGAEAVHRYILAHHTFMPRDIAEYDNTVKQIIPYVLIRQGEQYFLLRRLKKQTEARLHDKLSLGIGGHINPTEANAEDPLEAGLKRELEEEVSVASIRSLTCVGIINENNGGVSDYHTALVYLLEAEGPVTVRETEKMEGRWVYADELRPVFDSLETWSQLAAEHLIFSHIV